MIPTARRALQRRNKGKSTLKASLLLSVAVVASCRCRCKSTWKQRRDSVRLSSNKWMKSCSSSRQNSWPPTSQLSCGKRMKVEDILAHKIRSEEQKVSLCKLIEERQNDEKSGLHPSQRLLLSSTAPRRGALRPTAAFRQHLAARQ